MYSLKLLTGQDVGCFSDLTFPYFRSRLTQESFSSRMLAVGAVLSGQPVGLVLAELKSDPRVAEIDSIDVIAQQRHVGIGTALLLRIERELVARGCSWAEIAYVTERPFTPIVEGLLRKTGWPEPAPRATICKTDYDQLSHAPWMKRIDFPAPFQVFPWKDLTTRERADILESQACAEWFPEALNPFVKERVVDPMVSLGLRYRGQVVGWFIAQQVSEDTLSGGPLFVKKEFEARGRAISLLAQAIHASRNAGRRKFIFGVSFERPLMIRFVQNRMARYLTSIQTTKGSRKRLTLHSSDLGLQT